MSDDATFLTVINAKIAECEVTLSGINGDINELIAASGLRICSPEYMPSGISLDPMIEVDVKGRPVNPILANMYD